MDDLKERLGLNSLSEEWCNDMIKDDFCSDDFPETWIYDISLIGLEVPFRDFLESIRRKGKRVWDHLVLSDVSRLQCITNIVLESCIKGEGSPLTGLLSGACYLRLSTLEGATARNVFHNMLFGKVMELLKVQNDVSSFEGILAVYESLSEILESELTLSDQSYWLLVKSVLSSVNINCSNKKADNSSFNQLFSVVLTKSKEFKFFIKETSTYLLAGKSYVGDRCCTLICQFVKENSENQRVIAHHSNLIYTLCASISDRTEARKQVESYILKLVAVLPKECFFEFVDWIREDLCLSQKVVHRIFGAEMCFQLSFNDFVAKAEDLSVLESLYQTITLGLSDKAPTVRAKCAMVLSDLLKNSTTSLQKPLLLFFEPNCAENILQVVQLLSSDEKSSVRKSICCLLLMMLLKIKLRSSWLKIIYRFCLDTAVSVRKQGLMSVGHLLTEHESNPIVQRLWLETVLPAAQDNENSVKDYCNQQLENLLNKLPTSEHSWEMLQLISHPKSLDLQIYFDFSIHNLRGSAISEDCKRHIMEKINDPQFTQCVLLVVSKMVDNFKEVDSSQMIEIFEKCLKTRSDESYQTMCLSLKCLRSLKTISEADIIVEKLKTELQKFSHPYVVTKELIASITNLLHRTDKNRIILLCRESINDIGIVLQNLCLTKSAHDLISSMKMCCYLFTLGEIAMHFTSEMDKTVVLSVKELIIGNEEQSFSTSVRAHSIVALGKICLVHEDIAKDSVMLFSKVLEDDKNYEIRNNILIVLGDLIVRYPTIIAEYLYCVTDCLQDESVVVRRQAIIVLTKLLQEDYLKWRSGIVMKFISNLVCDDSEIRQLCELCLSNILLVRHPKTYFDFFIEVAFFVNGLFSFLTTTEPNLLKFSLPGKENEGKRRRIYAAMLQNLGDQQRLELTTRICKEILTLFVTDNDSPIDMKLTPLLRDSLWILCCPSLKLSSLKTRACHDFDDDDSNIGIIEAQTKVISNIVKRNFVENCTPIIIQLRQKLRRLKSPLQNDLTKFIVAFVTDFKNEIEVLSGDDAQFIAEVQYDMEEFKKRESNIQPHSFLQKTVIGNLMTPGFLKSFKTPNTSRALNLSLANQGPGMFLNSPFFAAPTPHSLSKSVTYKRPKEPSSNQVLRKNLLGDFRSKEASEPVVEAPEEDITNSQSSSDNQIVSVLSHEAREEDNEISYTEQPSTLKIVNSPGPSRNYVDNAGEVVGIKNEVLSPSEKLTKKLGRNLFNPDESVKLKNASMMSEDSVTDGKRSEDHKGDLLLTNKTETGCVRIQTKLEGAKRVLIPSQQAPVCSKSEQSENTHSPKKPIQLGQLIRQKLQEQKRRKAELAKTVNKDSIPSNTEVQSKPDHNKLPVMKSEVSKCPDQNVIPSVEFRREENPEDKQDKTVDQELTQNIHEENHPLLVLPDKNSRGDQENMATNKQEADKRKTRRSVKLNALLRQIVPAKDQVKVSSSKVELPDDSNAVSKSVVEPSSSALIEAHVEQEDKPSTENLENTPPRPTSEDALPSKPEEKKPELATRRQARLQKILKQFQPKQEGEKQCDPVFHKPAEPVRSSKRVNRLLAQLRPKRDPVDGGIVDKPENILLGNQVLRKRKNPNASGHCVYEEDDLPKPKRRSLGNPVELGNVTFDANDPKLIASTPAAPPKARRASERLMRKSEVSFNTLDPGIVSSTPFVPSKVVSKNIVSSTPAAASSRKLQLKCDLSPISDPSQNS